MREISIKDAVGFQLRASVRLASVNVSARMVTVEQGRSASFLTWKQLEQAYGITISEGERAKDESRLEATRQDLARSREESRNGCESRR